MRIALALVLVASACAKDIAVSQTSYGNTAVLGSPFTAISTVRAEFRVLNWTAPVGASTSFLFQNGVKVTVDSVNNWCVLSEADVPSTGVCLTLTPGTDYDIRAQRDVANLRLSIEACENVTGRCFAATPVTKTSMPAFNGNRFWLSEPFSWTARFSYVRVYSTAVAIGSPFQSTANGDLLDYEFDDSLVDSARGINLSWTGTATYTTTPILAPVLRLTGGEQTVRAGEATALTATVWNVNEGAGPVTVSWNVYGGPQRGLLTNATGLANTITLPTFGEYQLRLSAPFPGGLAETVTAVGAVSTDANGVVVTAETPLNDVIGLTTRSGKIPWSWADINEIAVAKNLEQFSNMSYGEIFNTTPLAGTGVITATNPTEMTGTGTSWATGADRILVDDQIWLNRSLDNTWALIDVRTSAPSNTFLNINGGFWGGPSGAVYQIYRDNANLIFWKGTSSTSTSNNFYDFGINLRRIHNRTGLTRHRTHANNLTDKWARISTGGGTTVMIPRDMGLHGIIATALDTGDSFYWDVVTRALQYSLCCDGPVNQRIANPTVMFTRAGGSVVDKREAGFTLRHMSLIARHHPDSAVRSTYCTYITNQFVNFWEATQEPEGWWQEDLYTTNRSYPTAPMADGRFGFSPWRGIGIPLGGLKEFWRAMESNYCNNTSLRARAGVVMTKAVQCYWDYGMTAEYGSMYDSMQVVHTQPNGPPPSLVAETVTVTSITWANGSTAVTGVGTQFVTKFTNQGVIDPYIGNIAVGKVVRVCAVNSETSITLCQPWAFASSSTQTTYTKAAGLPNAPGTCPRLATTCTPDPYGVDGRNVGGDTADIFAEEYRRTGNEMWKERAQRILGSILGGPADGTGGVLPCAGPYCGTTGNMDASLPSCIETLNSIPCLIGAIASSTRSKQIGQVFGAGNTHEAISWVLDPQPPDMRTVVLGYTAPAGATATSLELRSPAGVVTTTACAAGACSASVDRRQSSPSYRIVSTLPGGTVSGDWLPLRTH
jgi:hypothetical protein